MILVFLTMVLKDLFSIPGISSNGLIIGNIGLGLSF